MSRRRYKLLNAKLDDLLRLLVQGTRFVVVEGLPAGAKVVHVGYAPGDRFGIVLDHPDWPPVVATDLNALPLVGSKIAEVVPGPLLRVKNQKTGVEREVQAYVTKDDLEGTGITPPPTAAPPKVQLAGAGELGSAIRARAAGSCPTCGRAGGEN